MRTKRKKVHAPASQSSSHSSSQLVRAYLITGSCIMFSFVWHTTDPFQNENVSIVLCVWHNRAVNCRYRAPAECGTVVNFDCSQKTKIENLWKWHLVCSSFDNFVITIITKAIREREKIWTRISFFFRRAQPASVNHSHLLKSRHLSKWKNACNCKTYTTTSSNRYWCISLGHRRSIYFSCCNVSAV